EPTNPYPGAQRKSVVTWSHLESDAGNTDWRAETELTFDRQPGDQGRAVRASWIGARGHRHKQSAQHCQTGTDHRRGPNAIVMPPSGRGKSSHFVPRGR